MSSIVFWLGLIMSLAFGFAGLDPVMVLVPAALFILGGYLNHGHIVEAAVTAAPFKAVAFNIIFNTGVAFFLWWVGGLTASLFN